MEYGHILRARVCEIVPVDEPDAAVYDGLFHGLQTLLRTDDDVAEAQDEVHLETEWVVVIGVVQVQVHRIHILLRGRRDLDDLPVQALDERPILGLRVADDDVVAGQEVNAQNLSFCREALTRAGRAEDDTVRVLEQLAVDGNHVAAECIHAAVERARTALEQLLRRERHKNSEARRGQASLYLYAVESERQAAHKRVLLLEVQRHKLAVVLLRNALGLQHRVFELLQAVCRVEHGEGEQEHPLVAALQLLQELLRLAAVGGEVARQDVHVVTGPDCLLLLLYLCCVQLSELALHGLDGFHLVEGLDVHPYDERAVHLE